MVTGKHELHTVSTERDNPFTIKFMQKAKLGKKNS